VKIGTRIGGSCLGLLQTKTMSNISEEKWDLSNINEENKTSCVVIGGHPAGLMQSVFQLRRKMKCCDLDNLFLQIPFAAGVEHSLYLFMLFGLLFMLLKFFCFIASWSSRYNLHRCVPESRQTGEVVTKKNLRSVLIKRSWLCKRIG
jgi:hypothetical protein